MINHHDAFERIVHENVVEATDGVLDRGFTTAGTPFMRSEIEKIDNLHSAANSVLASIRESASAVKKLAVRLESGKAVPKRDVTRLAKQIKEWKRTFDEYRLQVDDDSVIKLWFMLLDVWHDVCLSRNRPDPEICWDDGEPIDAMHCHDALSQTAQFITGRLHWFDDSQKLLPDVLELKNLRALAIVDSEEFATGLDEEYRLARERLSQSLDYSIRLSPEMEYAAKHKILHRVNWHVNSIFSRSESFRRQYGKKSVLSKSTGAATQQASQKLDQAATLIFHIERVMNAANSVCDAHESFDIIKTANAEFLTPISIGDRTFPTAHEAVLGIGDLMDEVWCSVEGLDEQSQLEDLWHRLEQTEIPPLEGDLQIELTRTEAWLDAAIKQTQEVGQSDGVGQPAIAAKGSHQELETEDSADSNSANASQSKNRREWPSEPTTKECRHTFGPLTGTLKQFAGCSGMDVRTLYKNNNCSFFYIRKVTSRRYEVWLDSQKVYAEWNAKLQAIEP